MRLFSIDFKMSAGRAILLLATLLTAAVLTAAVVIGVIGTTFSRCGVGITGAGTGFSCGNKVARLSASELNKAST